MKRWTLPWKAAMAWAVTLVLGGCAAPQPAGPPPGEGVFNDALFQPRLPPPEASRLFELTPAMRQYLAERIQPQVRRKGAPHALLDALYTQGELRLEYDAVYTRTAAEAFEARKGNCLSLVIMTAAFARELGLTVRFRDVLDRPAIEPNGELTFVVGHVNLALAHGPGTMRNGTLDTSWLIVDFLPGQDLGRQQWREVDERRIRAQFMNNRAAEELARGRVDEAYGWLRGAHGQDPTFANLYNTLGVLYRHRGALPEAERALRAALALDPGNEHVAGNLNGLQVAQGRAPAVAQGPRPVSARYAAARKALDDGQLKQALVMLQGELGLTPRNPELHHLLAITQSGLGNTARARWHLERAAEYSAADVQRQRYAGKLERLKAVGTDPVLQ
jgi:tetratricopeptide (TPR) repeat protein